MNSKGRGGERVHPKYTPNTANIENLENQKLGIRLTLFMNYRDFHGTCSYPQIAHASLSDVDCICTQMWVICARARVCAHDDLKT